MDCKKVLLVYRVDRKDDSNMGVIDKLIGQVQALQNMNIATDYITHANHEIYLNQSVIYKVTRLAAPLWFKFRFWKYLPVNDGYDLIIIRYSLLVPSFIEWLARVKKANPKVRIVLDMPTYPYEDEWSGWKKKLGLYFDRKLRGKLPALVQGMLHSGPERSIFGIPTLHLRNGVNMNVIPQGDGERVHKDDLPFTLISIGKWQFWHGLDRVIAGLAQYKGDREVHFLIIGEGPVLSNLKKQASISGVRDRITFLGVKEGRELQQYIQSAHVGIGTLGMHRKGVVSDSSLKHRTYCAHSLPFVLSRLDMDFPDTLPFIHYLPDDDSPIDIDILIGFNQRLDRERIQSEMRKYATDKLSWEIKMKKLIAQL